MGQKQKIQEEEGESRTERENGKQRGVAEKGGGRWRKMWQCGVIAERIERVRLHLLVGREV